MGRIIGSCRQLSVSSTATCKDYLLIDFHHQLRQMSKESLPLVSYIGSRKNKNRKFSFLNHCCALNLLGTPGTVADGRFHGSSQTADSFCGLGEDDYKLIQQGIPGFAEISNLSHALDSFFFLRDLLNACSLEHCA